MHNGNNSTNVRGLLGELSELIYWTCIQQYLAHSECSSTSQTLSASGCPGSDTLWGRCKKVIDLELGMTDLATCWSLATVAGKVQSSQGLREPCQKS